MSDVLIDLAVIDEDGDNPFESIMSLAEHFKLEGSHFDPKGFEETVLYLERKMQDLSNENNERSRHIYSRMQEVITCYSKAAKIGDYNSFTVAVEGLNSIRITLGSIEFSSKLDVDIDKKFDVISPKTYLLSKGKQKATLSELSKAAAITVTNFGIQNPSKWTSRTLSRNAVQKKISDIWDVDFEFQTITSESHKPLQFIHQFIEILNTLDGVQAILEDIEVGSLKAKIKVLFEEAKNKEEVKELLESSKKFAKGKLEKEFHENERTKADTEKIEIEKKILEDQLQKNTSVESDYRRALEIQSAEEDLKRKKIENFRSQLQAIKEARDTYKELLSEGFISNGDFKMLINGIPFLSFENGELKAGDSIDVIENL